MKEYKHILASGCSFSYDGICGTPPTDNTNGGCSFIEDPDFPVAIPRTWPGILAQRMRIISLVNTASSNHGNILVANTIYECLTRYNYKADSTLVVMNLSDPGRFDIPCSFDSALVDKENIPWNKELIPYSYMYRTSDLFRKVSVNNLDTVEQVTTNAIEMLFTFLQITNIDFRFLVMTDCTNTSLQRIINKYYKNFVCLTPGTNMVDFCQATNTNVSNTDMHPNKNGHTLIANAVYETL